MEVPVRHTVFCTENICPLFGRVGCIEMFVNESSTAVSTTAKNNLLMGSTVLAWTLWAQNITQFSVTRYKDNLPLQYFSL